MIAKKVEEVGPIAKLFAPFCRNRMVPPRPAPESRTNNVVPVPFPRLVLRDTKLMSSPVAVRFMSVAAVRFMTPVVVAIIIFVAALRVMFPIVARPAVIPMFVQASVFRAPEEDSRVRGPLVAVTV